VVMLVMTDPLSDDASDRSGPAGRGGAKADTAITCVIAVDGRWWGHGVPSRDRVGDWAGKEEVSKKDRKRKVPAVY